MKNKLLLSSLLLLLISFSAKAQINNEEGTVYLKDAREVSGRINYFADDAANISVYDENGIKINLTPDQVREIKLYNGKRFQAKTYREKNIDQTLLLQAILLTQDKISLFKLEGSMTEFFVTKGSELHKLENNEFVYNDKSGSFKSYDHKYIATLVLLMQDRIDLTDKLQKLRLQEEDLTKILTEYAAGEITYYVAAGKEAKGKPYWSAFSQYSNMASYLMEETAKPSFSILIGFQYHFSRTGRSSLKVSLDHSSLKFSNRDKSLLSISTRYQYEIIQQEKFKFYFNAQLLDLNYYSIKYAEDGTRSGYIENGPNTGFRPTLRISPGLGFEYQPTQNLSMFFELNHVLQVDYLPKNHSLGFKYSFLK